MDEGELELRTDASDNGLGAILLQQQDNVLKPIGYYSRSLTKAELNYGVTEKECLAIVWAITKLRHYLFGRKFTVVTDHCGLCWLKTIKDPTARLARWTIKLQPYDFFIIYRSGKLHGDVDCISRLPSEPETEDVEHNEEMFPSLNTINVSSGSFKEEQMRDERVKHYISLVTSDTVTKRARKRLDYRFKLENGVLYYRTKDNFVPYLPKNLVQSVLKEAHEATTGGHLGVHKTLSKLQQAVY